MISSMHDPINGPPLDTSLEETEAELKLNLQNSFSSTSVSRLQK